MYIGVSREQLEETLERALEGRLSAAVAGRVVGRQVHLIYRRFGRGGKFYLRSQLRERMGNRTLSHQGLRQILVEGAAGFVDDAQAQTVAEKQVKEIVFHFGPSGHYYLTRGRRGTGTPEPTQREIFRAWYLGGEESRPEILNAWKISVTTLDSIIAKGQEKGWARG